MVTEDDIGKNVEKIGNPALNGRLLGFSNSRNVKYNGKAMVKRPLGFMHIDPEKLIICEDQSEIVYISNDEKIKNLCEIIMDEFPTNDPRYILAKSYL